MKHHLEPDSAVPKLGGSIATFLSSSCFLYEEDRVNFGSHCITNVLSLCEKYNIKFIALPPNSARLLQPVDVAYFRPLKRFWKKILNGWKDIPNGRSFPVLPKTRF